MKQAWISGLAFGAVLLFATSAFTQDYTLGFSGTQNFSGTEGQQLSDSYLAELTHAGDGLGAQGWSFGVTVEDGALGVITGVTTDGTTAADVFNSGFNNTSMAAPEDNGGVTGAVSAVVLCFGCPAVLPPNDTSSMLAIDIDWTIPAAEASTNLVYQGGLIGAGQPVDNVVTENGLSADFTTEPLVVTLKPVVTCCGVDFSLGFALARDAAVIDETETCSAAGRVAVGPGTAVYCQVVSNGDPEDSTTGVQGWSIGVEATGDIGITAVTTDNTSAAPEPDGRFDSGFNNTSLALPENNGGKSGVVSAVVLCFGCPAVLDPVSTESILQVTVDGELGAEGALIYAGGLVGEGQPVDLVLTVNGGSAPICNEGSGTLGITIEESGVGPFLRGDPNDDGKVNIADPIWIISELFRGGPATGCQIAADANGDDSIDLADAMYLIDYRFLGGAVPPAPFPACGSVEESALTCDTAQSSCQ